MTKKERIEQEVEKTLECFDSLEKIEPNPFFAIRVQAKIRRLNDEQEHPIQPWWSMRTLRPMLLSLLVVLNLLSAILVFRGSSDTQTDARSQYVAAFAEEYALTQDDYDIFPSVN